jgi:hypothetical protein
MVGLFGKHLYAEEVSAYHGGKASYKTSADLDGSIITLDAVCVPAWEFVEGKTKASGGEVIDVDTGQGEVQDDKFSLYLSGKARPIGEGGGGELADWSAYTSESTGYKIVPEYWEMKAGDVHHFAAIREHKKVKSLWRYKLDGELYTTWDHFQPYDYRFSVSNPGLYVINAETGYQVSPWGYDTSPVVVIGVGKLTATEVGVSGNSVESEIGVLDGPEIPGIFVAEGKDVLFQASIKPYGYAWIDNTPIWESSLSLEPVEEKSYKVSTENITSGAYLVKASCGVSKKYINVYVPKVDLTFDLNSNKTRENADSTDFDEINEGSVGGVLFVSQNGQNPTEPDLNACARLWASWNPSNINIGTVEISVKDSSKLRLWRKGTDGLWYNEQSSWSGNTDQSSPELWVEGVASGISQVGLFYKDKQGAIKNTDIVRVSIGNYKVEWQEHFWQTVDNNPKIGGGKRIYPGAELVNNTSGDITLARDTIDVKITTYPPVSDQAFYFKMFDVDDPSANTGPIDDETEDSDNLGTESIHVKQNPAIAPENTNQYGVAVFPVQVSMQPGNNYRLVIHEDDDFFEGLKAKRNVNNGVVVNSEGSVIPSNCMTDMLTVWRKLHVEIDSMSPVAGNSVSGQIMFVGPPVGNLYQLIEIPSINDSIWKDNEDGRFAQGVFTVTIEGVPTPIKVLQYESRNITADGFDTEIVRIGVNPNVVSGQQFVLEDDDAAVIDGVDPVVLPRKPNTGFMKKYYNDAYVEPILEPYEVSPYYDTNIPFALNVDISNSTSNTYSLSQKDLTSTSVFWSVKVVSAFQPELDQDYDNEDKATLGIVWDPLVGRPHGALIYLETIRDSTRSTVDDAVETEKKTVVHETGHQFGLEHNDGKNGTIADSGDDGQTKNELAQDDYIMTDDYPPEGVAPNEKFSPTSLIKIRKKDYPHK